MQAAANAQETGKPADTSFVAIEETDMPERTVGDQAGHADTDDGPRFRADDFRLRLDSPLFHRDPGMAAAAQAPQLRELTWEHVVRPNANQVVARSIETPTDGESLGETMSSASPIDLLPGL